MYQRASSRLGPIAETGPTAGADAEPDRESQAVLGAEVGGAGFVIDRQGDAPW